MSEPVSRFSEIPLKTSTNGNFTEIFISYRAVSTPSRGIKTSRLILCGPNVEVLNVKQGGT